MDNKCSRAFLKLILLLRLMLCALMLRNGPSIEYWIILSQYRCQINFGQLGDWRVIFVIVYAYNKKKSKYELVYFFL